MKTCNPAIKEAALEHGSQQSVTNTECGTRCSFQVLCGIKSWIPWYK